MPDRFRPRRTLAFALVALAIWTPGCATMRRHSLLEDLRPASDGFARTGDGWTIGIRHLKPEHPDPDKLPVVLCHGLGLNGTFWTITDNHLPSQLLARGYEVFIPDMRGSGDSQRVGFKGKVNRVIRETPALELGHDEWNVDQQANNDVPAILDYVQEKTGKSQVNWVGHSLGGMLMLMHLQTTDRPGRIASFVDMGGVLALAESKERKMMLAANRGLRKLLSVISTGRAARPMMVARPYGLDRVDSFYYTAKNVDQRTVSRFYGFTLEDPGKGALKQLESYLEHGRMMSVDGSIDYVEGLPKVDAPLLMIAGEADRMADIPSSLLTFNGVRSQDKTLLRFGKREGHVDDYGHCDLVWSRNAPAEIFPPLIEWLDRHQPGSAWNLPSPQQPGPTPQSAPARFPLPRAQNFRATLPSPAP